MSELRARLGGGVRAVHRQQHRRSDDEHHRVGLASRVSRCHVISAHSPLSHVTIPMGTHHPCSGAPAAVVPNAIVRCDSGPIYLLNSSSKLVVVPTRRLCSMVFFKFSSRLGVFETISVFSVKMGSFLSRCLGSIRSLAANTAAMKMRQKNVAGRFHSSCRQYCNDTTTARTRHAATASPAGTAMGASVAV
jgi:hypothetical protein